MDLNTLALPLRSQRPGSKRTTQVAMALLLLTVVAFSIGCTTKGDREPRTTGPELPPTAAFDTVLRYCPNRMESYLFVRHVKSGSGMSLVSHAQVLQKLLPAANPLVTVVTGRKFRMTGDGVGDMEGVTITRVENPIEVDPAHLLAYGKFHRHVLNGIVCYEREVPAEANPVEDWIAFLGETIVVSATRRSLLEESLRGQGSSLSNRMRLLDVRISDIKWGKPAVIVRQYDPDSQGDVYSPLNTGAPTIAPSVRGFDVRKIVCHLESEPRLDAHLRFTLMAETREPAKASRFYRELIGADGSGEPTITTIHEELRRDGEIVMTGTFKQYGGVAILILFGFNVFI